MTRIDLRYHQDLHRLAAYQYLEPWIRDRRVLEVGCGAGHGLRQLFALGARAVVGLDRDHRTARPRVAALEEAVSLRSYRPPRLGLGTERFDVVIVNDLDVLLGRGGPLPELTAALAPAGLLVVRAESGDRETETGGVPYGELLDLLEPRFPVVRVFGQSPFIAYSLVELTEEGGGEPGLTLDGALMGGGVEEVTSYLVLCGTPEAVGRETDYGIVQVPTEGDGALERWWDSLAAEEGDAVEEGDAAEADDAAEEGDAAEADDATVAPARPEAAPGPGDPVAAQDPGRVGLKAYTDAEGGQLARWRWPAMQ